MPFLDDNRWYRIYDKPKQKAAGVPAIFLDRDGVIIQEKNYLHDPQQVELIPGVAEKIKCWRAAKLPVIVVTNQSGIGQGKFGWPDYEAVHQRMLDLLGFYRPFTAVYANAHTPAESDAAWRKPNPGMLLQAAADLNLDLAASIMVGDKLVDVEAAARAGVRRLVHVKTGHGIAERPKIRQHGSAVELHDSLADVELQMPVA